MTPQRVTQLGAVLCAVISILVYFSSSWQWNESEADFCYSDTLSGNRYCRPTCQHGFFSLPGMDKCHPWLECGDMKDIILGEKIGQGAVKMVHRALWHGHTIALSTLSNPVFEDDFLHGLRMIRTFQPSTLVVQLLGSCEMTYFTEFHPLGSADQLPTLMSTHLHKYDNLKTRLGICVSYVGAIMFLHTSPAGTRVMCDSNDPNKTLSQFLVRADFGLILNDLDALPEVRPGEAIKCGHKELTGDYVAPEQLWPNEDTDFDDPLMPGYDEKTDVWKIPDVCHLLLGSDSMSVKLHLFEINARCKLEDPTQRPSVVEVFRVYSKTFDLLYKMDNG